VLLQVDRDEIVTARDRASKTWPSIVGFTVGCGFGALCESQLDLRSLVLPTTPSLVALAISITSSGDKNDKIDASSTMNRANWQREEPEVQRKAAAFNRWHEPDDARVSSPDL
jgi:hypothetical protein